MTGYLNAKGIRIFDYPEFAKTLRDRVRDRAATLAAEAGVTIEHIAKPHIRKEDCSATIRMVVGDNQDGYLRHRLVTSMAVPIAGCKGREVDCRLSLCSDNQASGWLFG
jgi:hypothetical protein